MADHGVAGALWGAHGVTKLRRLQLPQARQALRAADRELGAGDFTLLRARARAWWAVGEAWQGNLSAAHAAADDVLDAEPPTAAGTRDVARLALALVAVMRDELTAAHPLLDQIDSPQRDPIPRQPSIARSAGLLRARTLLAPGDTTRTPITLTQLAHEFADRTPDVADVVTAFERPIPLR